RQGVMAVFHYVPLHSSPAGKKYGRMSDDLPVTDDISSRLLRLPLYFEMNPDDVAIVSEAVHQFYLR
ncbi:MAG: DegT/DnrJ/EryC1/StrS family aminotransferase, partial [Desulfomonilaceae bacterium]